MMGCILGDLSDWLTAVKEHQAALGDQTPRPSRSRESSQLGDNPADNYPVMGSRPGEGPLGSRSPPEQPYKDATGTQYQWMDESPAEDNGRQAMPHIPHDVRTEEPNTESLNNSWQEQVEARLRGLDNAGSMTHAQ